MPQYSYFVCTNFLDVATLIKGDFDNSLFPELKAYAFSTPSEPWEFFGWSIYRVNRPVEDVVNDLVHKYGCKSDGDAAGIYRLKYLK